ncbi:hypothetical protein [Nocardia sp. NPDC051981]|uniref:hypothetical protein n=1 Tax=Nocardia sp. NPDC051981 TaxID=3155417 RepID=UPI003430C92D
MPDAGELRTPSGYQPTPERYGVGYQLGQVVPLSDGTQLQAVVRYPTDPATGQRAAGEFPVVVNFTTYGAVTSALTAAVTGVIDDLHIQLLRRWWFHSDRRTRSRTEPDSRGRKVGAAPIRRARLADAAASPRRSTPVTR